VKESPMQNKPTTVPPAAKQVGEVRARWAWTETSVWTDRMLAALENGVKGDVWFSLIDKVYNPGNLWAAWIASARNGGSAGVDRMLRGWFGYFKHSYRHVFLRVDKWVRGRLRSLLRKRHKHRGMARWSDQQRWTNAYFAGQGLISLKQAHALARQSAQAVH
jgi:Group II intron, maturase-specific domain